MTQLVEGLASLIVNNLTIRRWLFKIDDQTHGRGIGNFIIINIAVIVIEL